MSSSSSRTTPSSESSREMALLQSHMSADKENDDARWLEPLARRGERRLMRLLYRDALLRARLEQLNEEQKRLTRELRERRRRRARWEFISPRAGRDL